jgi:hypothetical protein
MIHCKDCGYCKVTEHMLPNEYIDDVPVTNMDATPTLEYTCIFNPVWESVTFDHYCGQGSNHKWML